MLEKIELEHHRGFFFTYSTGFDSSQIYDRRSGSKIFIPHRRGDQNDSFGHHCLLRVIASVIRGKGFYIRISHVNQRADYRRTSVSLPGGSRQQRGRTIAPRILHVGQISRQDILSLNPVNHK
jgi:hypothetical protein